MGVVMRQVWRCDVCGFEWMKGETMPEQCPSRACRSRRWNCGEVEKEASRVEKRRDRKPVDEPVKDRMTYSTSESVVVDRPGSCPVCGGELTPWGSSKRCGKCQRNW